MKTVLIGFCRSFAGHRVRSSLHRLQIIYKTPTEHFSEEISKLARGGPLLTGNRATPRVSCAQKKSTPRSRKVRHATHVRARNILAVVPSYRYESSTSLHCGYRSADRHVLQDTEFIANARRWRHLIGQAMCRHRISAGLCRTHANTLRHTRIQPRFLRCFKVIHARYPRHVSRPPQLCVAPPCSYPTK